MRTLLIFLFLVATAQAAEIKLAWDHPGVVDGYRVFMRTVGGQFDYDSPTCDTAEKQCIVADLVGGTRYSFVVRAYLGDQMSPNSDEIIVTAIDTPQVLVVPIENFRIIYESD